MAAQTWPDDLFSTTVDVLQSSLMVWQNMSFHYLFVGHALYCTMAGSEFKDRWLVHLLLTFLWGNGGGVVTAALIMQPKYATFSFFQDDFVLGAWVVCCLRLTGFLGCMMAHNRWLVNWAPGGHIAKLLNVWWIQMLAKSCTMLLRAQLIVSRVDLAVQLFPGVAAAALILGTIAGCGGRLLADSIMTGWQALPGLAELTSPSFASKSAAFAAISYYTLAYASQVLPVKAAAGLVLTALMLHTVASDLTGLPLDFTAPVTQLLHTITRVPPPPPQPQPAQASASLKRAEVAKQTAAAAAAAAAKSPGAAGAKPGSTKSPAKGTPVRQQGAATAIATAAASPAATTRKQGKAAAQVQEQCVEADEAHNTQQEQQQRGRKSRTSSVAADTVLGTSGGVTTRRRAAAAHA